MNNADALTVLDRARANAVLLEHTGQHYVYVLHRPEGTPFYVGKGQGNRVFQHEIEASGPNKTYKLNIIRAIRMAGSSVGYSFGGFFDFHEDAIRREIYLIRKLGRKDLGTGPLTNLTDGGEGLLNMSPISKEKHSATLAGDTSDSEERNTVNRFFQNIGSVSSVAVKPVAEFKPVALTPHPSPRKMTPRQAAALAASAVVNRVTLEPGARIPRRMNVDGVDSMIENGVGRDILKSGLASMDGSRDADNEIFVLNEIGCRFLLQNLEREKLELAGIVQVLEP